MLFLKYVLNPKNIKISKSEKKLQRKMGKKKFKITLFWSAANRLEIFYALEYTVIEGYKNIGIKNKQIEDLLIDEYENLLRRFRNSVFHYQNERINEKILGFLEKRDSEIWIYKIHNAFKKFFLDNLPITKTLEMNKWK